MDSHKNIVDYIFRVPTAKCILDVDLERTGLNLWTIESCQLYFMLALFNSSIKFVLVIM